MTPGEVARIVERRDEVAFVDLLRAADPEFADAAFEPALADALRSNPPLIDQWNMWSGDQRWNPQRSRRRCYDRLGACRGWGEHLRVHSDGAAAVADFIHRLAAWLARREVLAVEE